MSSSIMRIKERQQAIIDEFTKFDDWESRYKHIIALGKQLPPLALEYKTEDNKVKGCQSQLWMHAELNSQKQVVFQADSDALIVKGLVALMLRFYSGSTPEEILATPPDFIQSLQLAENLSPSRANGLHQMLKSIKYYAVAFQTLVQKS